MRYENGLLTIRANGITLSTILQEVHEKTGVTIENSAAGGEGQSRVVTELGPGEPAAVIAQLLYGTTWNYAVLGFPGNSGKIERILLMPKRAAAPQVARTNLPPAGIVAPQAAATAPADVKTSDAKSKDAAAEKADKQAKDDSDSDKTKSAKKTDNKVKGTTDKSDETASNGDQNSPPVFPDGLYRMYPSLFGGSDTSTANNSTPTIVSTGGSGNTPSVLAAMGGRAGTSVPADYTPQAPVNPQQFPPELWKLYPPNILDLVKNAAPPPPVPVPAYVPPGSGVMWDQGIQAK